MAIKIGFKYYFCPTPAKVKNFADLILTAFGSGGILITEFSSYPKIGIIIVTVALLIKGFSNFFIEIKPKKIGNN